jgi:hypothetical protein
MCAASYIYTHATGLPMGPLTLRAHDATPDRDSFATTAYRYGTSDVGDSGRTGLTAARAKFTGVPAMTHPARDDRDDIPIGWIRWSPVGELGRDEAGDLVFPSVPAEPGIYRFLIQDGTGVTAGYVGQAAKSLAERFNLYRTRGRKPSYPLERKTTSRNALRLIA